MKCIMKESDVKRESKGSLILSTDVSLPQDLQPPSTGTRNLQVVRDHSSSVLKDKLGPAQDYGNSI